MSEFWYMIEVSFQIMGKRNVKLLEMESLHLYELKTMVLYSTLLIRIGTLDHRTAVIHMPNLGYYLFL
jgi:hypothetical protein